jgi:Putative zinc-finger
MTTPRNTENQIHDQVWELLPWYVNEGLSPREVNDVEAHLKGCPACQNEIERCQDLKRSVSTSRQDEWTPSAAHFSTLLASVDAFEDRKRKSKTPSGWVTKWFSWLGDTPRPARFALALQGALVVALAMTTLLHSFAPTPAYQTLSNPAERYLVSGQPVRLVFTEDITEREMRTLLLEVQGRIVAGPSSLGVYTIVLESADSKVQTNQRVLTQLRAHPKVRLAEMAGKIVE